MSPENWEEAGQARSERSFSVVMPMSATGTGRHALGLLGTPMVASLWFAVDTVGPTTTSLAIPLRTCGSRHLSYRQLPCSRSPETTPTLNLRLEQLRLKPTP